MPKSDKTPEIINFDRLEQANRELHESLEEIFSFHRQTKRLMGVHDIEELYVIAESLLDSATDFVYYRMLFFDEFTNKSSVVRSLCPGELEVDEELISWSLAKEEQVHAGVEANVHLAVSQLREIAERESRPLADRMKVVGAVYELETGRVRILE